MSSGGPTVPTPAMPSGYEFVAYLGQGGSGWVALARQTGLGRLVAVKRIFGANTSREALERVRSEGRVLAAVGHRAIVEVFDVGPVDNDIALVMQYAECGDLRKALDRGDLTMRERVTLLLDIGSALEHAHRHGVVHRDVKPGNVLITATGQVKLADFGLAALAPTTAAGTPRYMAPEQRSPSGDVGPAADAYAFAVLAHELLAGSVPEGGAISKDLPRRVCRALTAALDSDPSRRPPVSAMCAALAAVNGVRWDRVRPDHSTGGIDGTSRSNRSSDTSIWSGHPEHAASAARTGLDLTASDDASDAPSDARPLLAAPAGSVRPPIVPQRRWANTSRSLSAWLVGAAAGIVIVVAIVIAMHA